MKSLVIVLVVVAGVLAFGAAAFFIFFRGPDLRPYLSLKEPRIVSKDDERVVQVAFSGKADEVIKPAFAALFKTYFRIKDAPKGPGMKPPRARYVVPPEVARDPTAALKAFQTGKWSGAVAIPVPAGLALPPQAPTEPMRPELGTWKYGEVAEILHLGPYEAEVETIKKLEEFIASRGYEIAGDHEEEYLRGPGMPLVSPKDYWTIVRYQVRKKSPR